jgi:autotransporter-associated beta strand protein
MQPVVVLFLALLPLSLFAQSWDGSSNNRWDRNDNWTPSGFPDGPDESATLGAISTSETTIDLRRDIELGTLNIQGSTNFTITGNDVFEMSVSSGSAAINISGSHSSQIASVVELRLTDNTVISNTGTGTFSILAEVTSSGSLTHSGSGTTLLNNANTFSGGLIVNGGTVRFGNNSAAGSGSLTLNGGFIEASGGARTLGNNIVIGGNFGVSGSQNLTLTDDFSMGSVNRVVNITNSATTIFNGDISGSAGFTKTGTGTLRMNGTNTFSGNLTVTNGLVELNSPTINGGVPNSAGLIVGDGIGAANSAIVRNFQEGQVGNLSTVTVYSDGWFDINAAAYPDKGGVAGYREETVGQINLYGGRITTGNPGSLNIDASLPGAGISSFASSQTALIDATGGLVDFKGVTRTISVEDGSQTTDLEIRGNLTNGGVVKTGDGRLTYTGTEANTYTGPTTINGGTLELAKTAGVTSIAGSAVTVNSGGTLLLGSSNQINNAANLTLNSGTFSTGDSVGFSETLGTLTLSGSSSIDLGTGVHLLQFANSSSLSGSWSGSLTIYGWTGLPLTSGTSGQIYFGNNVTGLTSSQLAMISFNGFGQGAILLSTGELVPVAIPEAETVLAASLLVFLVGYRERRRLPFLFRCRPAVRS